MDDLKLFIGFLLSLFRLVTVTGNRRKVHLVAWYTLDLKNGLPWIRLRHMSQVNDALLVEDCLETFSKWRVFVVQGS